jgi:uncharacterized protein (DUF924 family)
MHSVLHKSSFIQTSTPAEALAVVNFWREAGPSLWFAKDRGFDQKFRDAFLSLHDAATLGRIEQWKDTAEGALALVLLLDQFPRNAFRGSMRLYASDVQARKAADAAIAAGHDRTVEPDLQVFFYLPFAHSEALSDQDRAVALCSRLPPPSPANAARHRDIIRRFGRFPHRNPILRRHTTLEEQAYLDLGGYAG